jgi:hypothetical protein
LKGIGRFFSLLTHIKMKTKALIIFIALVSLLIPGISISQVAITTDGSSPDNSAMLDVNSTTKGLLLPRLSDAVRDAMVSPAKGLLIYNTTSNKLNFYGDGKWFEFTNIVCVPEPTTANAGPDQMISVATTTLAGNTAVSGTGTWTIRSGTGGSITDIHLPASVFTGSLGVSYKLQWAISTPCNTSKDSVIISLGPTCSNGITDGTETDVDCGGLCTADCAPGKHCLVGADCQSGICTNNVCTTPSCSDGVKNGTETDVDCGGSCVANCATGKHCLTGADCQSNICVATICQAPTCTDGMKNGTETDVDCGGGTCPTCADNKMCSANSDCTSGVCTNGVCRSPTCSDGVKNGTETDVDCGGSCPAHCAIGKHCLVNADCTSGFCNASHVCQ